MKAAWNIGLIAAATLLACGGDNGPRKASKATIEAFDDGLALAVDGTIGVSPGSLQVGDEAKVSEIRLINTGDGDLKISDIAIASNPPGVFTLAGDANGGAMPSFPQAIAPEDDLDGQRSLYVYLRFKRPASGETPTAVITVSSNSVSSDGKDQTEVHYNVRLQNAAPTIQVTPKVVNFGTVQQGQAPLQSINILNPGADTLLINSFTLTGHPNFKLIIGSKEYPVSPESASTGIVLETPLSVDPGMTVPVSVQYKADDGSEARGTVVFFSNDPAAAAGTPVTLQANVGGPCISVNPHKVAFGGKLVGKTSKINVEITSCGDQNLQITEIGLTPDSNTRYSLTLDALPGVTGTPSVISPSDAPIVLQPNQKATLTVDYFPDAESPVDGNNDPIYDTGTLRIRSNSFQPELLADITGFGVLVECPTATIIAQEGEEVVPQTKLHLIGSQSTAATGEIGSYHWEVDQPVGSESLFTPSNAAPDPTFEVNVAGHYVFRLTVTDSTGEPSCVPAEYEVFVNPDQAIHIELLWNTPNDPDQTDDNGADVDLHFLHPLAIHAGGYDGDNDGLPDGWFDEPYDCFWYNPQTTAWGSQDPNIDDDPSLDRDDTDGAGPENMNLNLPENGLSYRVGVDYWDDHTFGTSYATVRIYIYAILVFEMTDVELFKHDMWTVTNIDWPPSGTAPQLIKVCGGTTNSCQTDADCGAAKCGLRIQPNYSNPAFFQ